MHFLGARHSDAATNCPSLLFPLQLSSLESWYLNLSLNFELWILNFPPDSLCFPQPSLSSELRTLNPKPKLKDFR